MLDLILSVIPGGGVAAIGAIVLAALAGAWGLIATGRKQERNRQRAKDADAYEKHIEDIANAHDARNRADRVRDDKYRRD